jgi:hypothetical protein
MKALARRFLMPDLPWLALLGGLVLATLALVRVCDDA